MHACAHCKSPIARFSRCLTEKHIFLLTYSRPDQHIVLGRGRVKSLRDAWREGYCIGSDTRKHSIPILLLRYKFSVVMQSLSEEVLF